MNPPRFVFVDFPCKNCPNRHPLCHDHCETYLAIKAEQDKRRKDKQDRRIPRYHPKNFHMED